VENTHANESRCNEIVLEANRRIEPLVTAPKRFHRSYEHEVSTRDRVIDTEVEVDGGWVAERIITKMPIQLGG
jgi:hypothetical protein